MKATAKHCVPAYKMNKKKKTKGYDLPTSGLAAKTSSNCFKTSGGDILSISAPSTAIGTLTTAIDSKHLPLN